MSYYFAVIPILVLVFVALTSMTRESYTNVPFEDLEYDRLAFMPGEGDNFKTNYSDFDNYTAVKSIDFERMCDSNNKKCILD